MELKEWEVVCDVDRFTVHAFGKMEAFEKAWHQLRACYGTEGKILTIVEMATA